MKLTTVFQMDPSAAKKWLDRILDAGEKVTRNAFLYVEPKNSKQNDDTFAQCESCVMWTGAKRNTCTIHGPKITTKATASCGWYVPGAPDLTGKEIPLVTPEESGLVTRQVRCENCVSFRRPNEEATRGTCELFATLNKQDPKNYELDDDVHKHGCCNAQRPV